MIGSLSVGKLVSAFAATALISFTALLIHTPKAYASTDCSSVLSPLPTWIQNAVKANKPFYQVASDKTGVPWELLAAIHYRETSFSHSNPANGQGIFQFVNGDGGPYPPGAVSDENFQQQLNYMAGRIQSDYVYRGTLPYTHRPLLANEPDDYRVQDTLYSYNGRSSQYAQQGSLYGFSPTTQPYQGSPYVSNMFDCARANMGLITRDYGSIDGIDTRYGAYTLYTRLKGDTYWKTRYDYLGTSLRYNMPTVYKTPNAPTVYIQATGYKFSIPSMAILQDFGINPNGIGSISQDVSNAIPVPEASSGLSASIGSLVKTPSDYDSDGPTLYLVSVGKKYPIPAMSFVEDYGLGGLPISSLPAAYLDSIQTDKLLTNFIKSPNGSLFHVKDGKKHIIFDSAKYETLAAGSYAIPISNAVASFSLSSDPLSTNPVILKSSNSSAVYAYAEGDYFVFPNLDSMHCWGVNTRSELGLNTLESSYLPGTIATSGNLSCMNKDDVSGSTYLLSKTVKYMVPSSYSYQVNGTMPQKLSYLYSLIPTASRPLKQAVKGSGPAVWYIEQSVRRIIPSYSNLGYLGFKSDYTTIDDSSISALGRQEGIKLGTGQPVKTPEYGAIYIINGSKRVVVPNSEIFNSFKFNWQNIETYDPAQLDARYPIDPSTPLGSFYTDPDSLTTYVVGSSGCYRIPDQLITTYAQDPSRSVATQAYSANLFPNLQLANCSIASDFIKSSSNPTVYQLKAGVKHPISSWTKLVSLGGGTVPPIVTLPEQTIAPYSVGQTL